MNLDHIKLFTLVVQQGSLSAASLKSGVAVATLSRKISDLEESLGVQLLERSTQGVKPTLIGLQLSEQAALSLETLSDLARRIKSSQTELKGRLRLSIPESFELWWEVQHAFAERYPDIDVHLLASDRKLDLLADGIDAAVRIGDLQTDTVVAKKLFDIRLQLVATPEFVQRHGSPKQPSELPHFRCCAWSAHNSQTVIWQPGGNKQPITPHFASNDYKILRDWLLHYPVIGDLPDFMAKPLIEQGKLVEILPDYPFPAMPVHLLYPGHRHLSSIVRAYVDFCSAWAKERFADSP